MKKLLKWTLILAAAAAVVLLAAYITLKMMFPTEKVKALVQNYAQNTLQREVTFSDISFNLIGVTLNNVAISEAKTFEQGSFIQVDHAVVKIALIPLLRKQIDITTIGLKGLKVNVVKNQDGSFNFDDLIASSSAEETPASEEEPSDNTAPFFAVAAQNFFIKNATIFYKDLQENQELTLSNINVKIDDFDLAAPFTARLQLQAAYKNAQQALQLPIRISLLINLANLNLAQAYVTVQNISTQYNGLQAVFKGGVKNFEQPVINIQGDLSGISNTSLADLAADLPHFSLPKLHMEADATLDLQASAAALTNAKLALGNSTLTASGNMSWAEPAFTYNIQSNIQLQLDQLGAMSQLLDGYHMGGSLSGQFTATDKKDGQDVRGTLQLNQLALTYAPVTVSELNGTIHIASLQNISASNITGKLNGGPFTASFTYKDLGKLLDIGFDLDLSKLKLDSFSTDTPSDTAETATAQPSQPAAADNGPETLFNVRANVAIDQIEVPYLLSQGANLKVNLQKASASLQQASGTVSFELKEGAITDVMSSLQENKIVKILLLPFTLVNKVTSKLGIALFPKNEQAGQIKFTSGSGTYVFTNGLMQVQETHFNSSISDMTAAGKINFKTEAIDMNVKASVLTSQTPIVIKIGGTVSEPSGKLDITKTAVSLVGGILNYKTPGKAASSTVHTAGKVTESVIHKAAGSTKSAVNTGSEAVSATVKTAAEAVKGIGGLFKKKSPKDTAEEKTEQ